MTTATKMMQAEADFASIEAKLNDLATLLAECQENGAARSLRRALLKIRVVYADVAPKIDAAFASIEGKEPAPF